MSNIPALIGTETPSNSVKRTQVYLATHEGDDRLPFMYRSFISFSYDGINCEDLGLIAVVDGDRMNRSIYGQFEDTTSELKAVDGQLYWGSFFTTNELTLTLATDGITEKQLGEIKRWLRPGPARELVLAENPNRAIMARIGENPPEYHLLPFEEYITIKVAGHDQQTSTTLYKGDISVTFIMDQPFWHAVKHIFESDSDKVNFSGLSNTNTGKDTLKVIAEDGIPTVRMALNQPGVLYGTNNIVNKAMGRENPIVHYGQVHHAILGNIFASLTTTHGVDFGTNPLYFYYPGTAPAAPTIEFTLAPQVGAQVQYVSVPNNNYASGTSANYNTITIEGEKEKQVLKITTPGVWTAYNQAISILSQALAQQTDEAEVRKLLRDNVNHHAVRSYAIYCYDQAKATGNSGWGETALNSLYTFFKGNASENDLDSLAENPNYYFLAHRDNNSAILPAHFTINGETGECFGEFFYQTYNETSKVYELQYHKEEVGDMVVSNYLQIKERNEFDSNGFIGIHAINPKYSHKIYHDFGYNTIGANDVVTFDGMYLYDFLILYDYYYY